VWDGSEDLRRDTDSVWHLALKDRTMASAYSAPRMATSRPSGPLRRTGARRDDGARSTGSGGPWASSMTRPACLRRSWKATIGDLEEAGWYQFAVVEPLGAAAFTRSMRPRNGSGLSFCLPRLKGHGSRAIGSGLSAQAPKELLDDLGLSTGTGLRTGRRFADGRRVFPRQVGQAGELLWPAPFSTRGMPTCRWSMPIRLRSPWTRPFRR
jgi:hypothetical protein